MVERTSIDLCLPGVVHSILDLPDDLGQTFTIGQIVNFRQIPDLFGRCRFCVIQGIELCVHNVRKQWI
jgi:hypothetical protein